MPRLVQQSVRLAAKPEALYRMYLDPLQHAAFTGKSPVRIAAVPGAEFWGFEGMIHGRVLALTPGRQIVQSWRSLEWMPDDLDATLVLTFWPDPDGARVDLNHVNVPDHLYEKIQIGWPNHYWNPWRAYLARSASS